MYTASLLGHRACPSNFFGSMLPRIVCLASIVASCFLVKMRADILVYGSCPSIYNGRT